MRPCSQNPPADISPQLTTSQRHSTVGASYSRYTIYGIMHKQVAIRRGRIA